MKRRIDYERQPPPKYQKEHGRQETFISTDSLQVVVAEMENCDEKQILVILGIDNNPFRAAFDFQDKEQVDSVIASLIAARNQLWPGG